MVVSQLVTVEKLAALAEVDKRYELVVGELVEMSPTGTFHGEVVSLLTEALNEYNAEARRFRIRAGETGYIFGRDPDTVLVPDISVLTKEQYEAAPRRTNSFRETVPMIVIGVKSPANREAEIARKVGIYLGAGVREVWWVRPDDDEIWIHRPDESPKAIHAGETLTSPALLPGFRLPVSTLFDI